MNKSQVLADIRAKIKTNGNQEITGDILQSVLTESVNLVPDLVSELTNDAKYQTEEEVDAKVNTKADIAQVTDLNDRVKANTVAITALQTEMGNVNTQLTEING